MRANLPERSPCWLGVRATGCWQGVLAGGAGQGRSPAAAGNQELRPSLRRQEGLEQGTDRNGEKLIKRVNNLPR